MPQFSFTLLIHGADVLTEDAQHALFDAGCGDTTFGASDHVQRADFDREAADLAEAMASAINAIEWAVSGARVDKVLL